MVPDILLCGHELLCHQQLIWLPQILQGFSPFLATEQDKGQLQDPVACGGTVGGCDQRQLIVKDIHPIARFEVNLTEIT